MKTKEFAIFACFVVLSLTYSNANATDYTSTRDGWFNWVKDPNRSDPENYLLWTSPSGYMETLPTVEDTFTYDSYTPGSGVTGWFQTHLIGNDIKSLGDDTATFYAKSMYIAARKEIYIRTIAGETNAFDLAEYVAPSLHIAENATFKTDVSATGDGSAQKLEFGKSIRYAGFDKIYIGGDLDVSGVYTSDENGASVAFVWNMDRSYNNGSQTAYGENLLSLEVGGQMKIGDNVRKIISFNAMGGGGTPNQGTDIHAFVQLGGLEGSGMLANSDHNGRETTIIFKTNSADGFQGGNFSGGAMQNWEAGGTINFVMDSGSSNIQSISITETPENNAARRDLAALNATVRSGALALGNKDGATKFTSVKLFGGNLAFTDLKQIRTQSFEWDSSKGENPSGGNFDGGKMIFTIYEKDSDFDRLIIEDGGTAQFTGDEFLFEIVIEDGSMLAEGFSKSYGLISGNVAGLDADNAKFKFTDANGNDISGNFTGAYDSSANLFTFSYVIPEPATLAAIFGAFALALAACRRRK